MKKRKIRNYIIALGIAALVAGSGIIALLSALSFVSPANAQGRGGNDTQKTPNVTVVNRPANPVQVRNVDGPTRQPVSAEVELTVLSEFDGTAGVIYAVPAGKLLVIEYLSARAKLPHDQGVAELAARHVCSVYHQYQPISKLSIWLAVPRRSSLLQAHLLASTLRLKPTSQYFSNDFRKQPGPVKSCSPYMGTSSMRLESRDVKQG